MQILFELLGEPVEQGRPRASKSWTGKTVLYGPEKSRDFKQYVKLVAGQHAPKELITGPIDLAIDHFYRATEKVSDEAKTSYYRKG